MIHSPISPARPEWQDGAPYSPLYGDIYFSKAGGAEETLHVFLEGNGLPERWETLAPQGRFTIGEIGFGTGLNFLLTSWRWLKHAPPGATLHYWSVEGHPFLRNDLQAIHALWPDLSPHSEELLAGWPPPLPGFHRLALAGGKIRLTLLFGEAHTILENADFTADAWYLDGFAPSRNPEAWDTALCRLIASHTAPQGTYATYSAAGKVRRAMTEAGFTAKRRKGFGHKRECLAGMFGGDTLPANPPRSASHPVLIAGAGLAGCAAAHALATRGHEVILCDRQTGPAMETSGNEAAILFPQTALEWTKNTQFYFTAYAHTLALLARLRAGGHMIAGGHPGMLLCPKSKEDAKRLPRIPGALGLHESILRYVSQQEASGICGPDVHDSGLFFPQGGWASLPELCRALLAHKGITTRYGVEITGLTRGDHHWQAHIRGGEIIEASRVVLACAHSAPGLWPEAALPVGSVRGQITRIPATLHTRALKTVLCYGGYMLPESEGFHHLGATYDRHEAGPVSAAAGHLANFGKLRRCCPGLPLPDPETCAGWSGVRATSPDRLPMVGALTGAPGLYTTLAHGSRGLLSCPLSGEILAAHISGEAIPLPRHLLAAISPSRFNK